MTNRIRDIRKAKGLTLADLGAACDPPTTAQTIGRLETGMRQLSLTWMNRIAAALGVEAASLMRGETAAPAQIVHFPKSCLHCADAPCVTVCPTGASYKRAEDGIVLVNEDACIGCGLCAWACPYGAREMDAAAQVMKKCTLCVDRIYNAHLPEEDRVPACVRTCPSGARHFGDLGDPDSAVSRLVEARGGFDLMPEQATRPTNKYLPPRLRDHVEAPSVLAPYLTPVADTPKGFLGWLDRALGALPGGAE